MADGVRTCDEVVIWEKNIDAGALGSVCSEW